MVVVHFVNEVSATLAVVFLTTNMMTLRHENHTCLELAEGKFRATCWYTVYLCLTFVSQLLMMYTCMRIAESQIKVVRTNEEFQTLETTSRMETEATDELLRVSQDQRVKDYFDEMTPFE
jgi:hypothetical protein